MRSRCDISACQCLRLGYPEIPVFVARHIKNPTSIFLLGPGTHMDGFPTNRDLTEKSLICDGWRISGFVVHDLKQQKCMHGVCSFRA